MLYVQGSKVYIIIHKEAESMDILKSYFHVEYLQFIYDNMTTFNLSLTPENSVEISYQFVKSHFDGFVDALSVRGWVTDYNLLGPTEWRSVWAEPQKSKKYQ